MATPAALEAVKGSEDVPLRLLARHVTGDWSEMSEAGQHENELSVEEGDRIVSRYGLPGGESILIITEWDRSQTTLMLGRDY